MCPRLDAIVEKWLDGKSQIPRLAVVDEFLQLEVSDRVAVVRINLCENIVSNCVDRSHVDRPPVCPLRVSAGRYIAGLTCHAKHDIRCQDRSRLKLIHYRHFCCLATTSSGEMAVQMSPCQHSRGTHAISP